jgi:parvulin-like peptidyl-prolyl isomerase
MKPHKLPLAILSLAVLAAPSGGEILERVVAKVNGDIVTLSEFVNRQVAAVQQARVAGDQIQPFLQSHNARILQEAIDDLLLYQRAGELGIRMRPEYINEFIEGIKKENNLTSDAALQEQLRREGMTLDDLKRNIERSILRRQVLSRELEQKVTVTEADARAEYDRNLKDYTRPGKVHLQEILLKSDGAAALAAQLVARTRAGEDFAALAKAFSEAPTAASGGDLGSIAKGELNPELERVAFAMAPGQISEPLRTNEGVRILRLVERSEETVVPFEQVKNEIRERLAQEVWKKEYEQYLEGLRKGAMIEVKVREVPLALASPPPASSIIDVPALGPETAPPAPADDAEIVTSPQAKPERVAPVLSPGESEKTEEPTPSPTPTPSPRPPGLPL